MDKLITMLLQHNMPWHNCVRTDKARVPFWRLAPLAPKPPKPAFSSERQDSRIKSTQVMHLTRNGFWIMQTLPSAKRKGDSV